MPFYPPFNMPFFYNNYRYPRNPTSSSNSSQKKETMNFPQNEKISTSAYYNYETRQKVSENYYNSKHNTSKYNNDPKQKILENNYKQKEKASGNPENSENREVSEFTEVSEAFFEIFGLKLYFDDILIMCILFFLYTEKVHDDELFICLILLLLT